MDYFRYRNGKLHCEDLPVSDLAARHGTPLYLYSTRTIIEHYRKLAEAFQPVAPIICYSIKANSNLSILRMMREHGSGFDVVSGGELFRALKIGADPKKIAFAGVGKTDEEIAYALDHDILLFNVESEEELENIDRIAAEKKTQARCTLRINPDVDPHTHTYITTGKKENKFGIDLERAAQVIARRREFPRAAIRGLHFHIGSQITRVEPYVETLQRVAEFLPECRKLGCPIEWLDIGGGFGIWYKEKLARPAGEIASALIPLLQRMDVKVVLEPGRFIVGNAGILLTRVLYVKRSGEKKFVICDAGMTDLISPTLYCAYHRIWPVETDPGNDGESPDEEHWRGPLVLSDVVGPICESGDFFAKDRKLPELKRGDLVAVFSAGAYGFAMSSNYNSHRRPCEVAVAGQEAKVVTQRETHEDLLRNEPVVSISSFDSLSLGSHP